MSRWLSDPLNACLAGNALLLISVGVVFSTFAPPQTMGTALVQSMQSNAVPLAAIFAFTVVALVGIGMASSLHGKRAFAYAAHVGAGIFVVALMLPPIVRVALA